MVGSDQRSHARPAVIDQAFLYVFENFESLFAAKIGEIGEGSEQLAGSSLLFGKSHFVLLLS